MSQATYEQRLIAGLQTMGWQETTSASGKYTAFAKPGRVNAQGKPLKLFVGSNGALRTGLTASNSHSIGDPSHRQPFYNEVLKAGEKALNVTSTGSVDTAALLKQLGGENG